MRTNPILLLCAALVLGNPALAKQEETEGMASMSAQSRDLYQQTDPKAAQRPGQTIHAQPIPPIPGDKGPDQTMQGEETSGTGPAPPK